MAGRPSAVIFDIGNVLVRWSPRALYERLIEDKDELEWFLSHVVTLDWHTHHDAGRPLDEGVRLLSRQYPAYAGLIAQFQSRWDETIIGPIEGSVSVLETLDDAGVPVYAVTNYSAETFPAFRRDFPFAARFRDVVVSGEHGVVKPDPRIYDLALRRFRVSPGEAVFVDDRQDNVDAARAQGLHGILFTDPDTLRADLRTLNLPI